MVEYTADIHDAMQDLARLQAHKRPDGTKIHYAEKRLQRLIEAQKKKTERKKFPRKPPAQKPYKYVPGREYAKNRAYVLSREIYDLTQAMVALERLR